MNKEIENIIKNWNNPATLSHEEIKSLIDKAIKQERERIIEEIEKMEIEEVGNSTKTANQIIDIIKKIK